jgi:hypothetical protein
MHLKCGIFKETRRTEPQEAIRTIICFFIHLGLLDAVYLCLIFSVLQARLARPGLDHFTAKISLNCRDEANLIYNIS